MSWGTCTVPDGRRGLWTIDTITLTREDVMLTNMRYLRDGDGYLCIPPGTYRRLHHEKRGVVMSNTPMEKNTSFAAYKGAVGSVLINGLGLGMVLEGILTKPEVTRVRIVELDLDVIALVGPHFANDPRVEITQGDAYEYVPGKDERYDFVWHDIWDNISSENLPKMAKLTRKWSRRAGAQAVWSRKEARREARRYR